MFKGITFLSMFPLAYSKAGTKELPFAAGVDSRSFCVLGHGDEC